MFCEMEQKTARKCVPFTYARSFQSCGEGTGEPIQVHVLVLHSGLTAMDDRVKQYLKALGRELSHGKTTEHTHRPALKAFVESLAEVLATNEPGREKCGAPDFVITKAGPVTVGYLETKDIGKSLDEAERSDQLKRYLLSLPNLILTDYLEFRWYVNGEKRRTFIHSVPKFGKQPGERGHDIP